MMTFLPELPVLAAFSAAAIVIILSPGPDMTLFLARTVAQGRSAGFASYLGASTGLLVHTLFAAFGLSALLAASSEAYAAVKIAGAGYLIYLAWKIWRSAGAPVAAAEAPRARAFVGGVLVNLANPKSVLFAGAVLVVIFPIDISLAHKALVVANHLAVEIIVYSTFALALSSEQVSARYMRLKPVFDRVAAVADEIGPRLA